MRYTIALATSSVLAAVIASPIQSSPTVPVGLRECYITKVARGLMSEFATLVSNHPPTEIKQNMGRMELQHNVNGTCLQVQVYNWSCDHNLTVTGPNLANAIESIADQCDGKTYTSGETAGPVGFGYYTNVETGHDYTRHLWVVTGGCGKGRRQSACSPGA